MPKSTFGKRIIAIREKEHLTQKEFCEITGIPLDTLKGIESKGIDPRGSTLEKIARYFPQHLKALFSY